MEGCQASYLLIRPLVTHDTDRFHGQQNGKRLADLIVQVRLTDLLDVDVVRVLQNLHLLARDRTKDPYSEPRTRERMALDKMRGN